MQQAVPELTRHEIRTIARHYGQGDPQVAVSQRHIRTPWMAHDGTLSLQGVSINDFLSDAFPQ